MEYQIIADGACDLYGENADKIGVQIVPFYVAFEENVYKKEGAEIEVRHFYKEMVEKQARACFVFVLPRSSAALIIQRSMPEICSWKIIRMQRLK